MTLPHPVPYLSIHTENGLKLMLALLGPVLAVLLCHWRIAALRRATSASGTASDFPR